MSGELRLEHADAPAEADARRLYDEVRAFNARHTGLPRYRTFAVFLRDAEGALLGGVEGGLWGNALHINVVWVDAALRGQGHASHLMAAAEDHGRAQGARLAYVETMSFQARPFYERLGYRVFGELPGIADGETMYFLSKALAPLTP